MRFQEQARMPLIHHFTRFLFCLTSLVVTLGISAAVAAEEPASADDAVHVRLRQWEHASASRSSVTPDELSQRFRDTHSAHELAVATDLIGPVKANELTSRYIWAFAPVSTDTKVRLVAIPKDTVSQLFCRSILVTLDTTGAAASVRFVGVADKEVAPTNGIQLVEAIHVSDLHRAVTHASAKSVESRTGNLAGPLASQSPQRMATNGNGFRLLAYNDAEDLTTDPNATEQTPITTDAQEVAAILDRWTKVGRSIETLETTFHKTEYDASYRVEIHTQGHFRYEAPNRGLLTMRQPAQPVRKSTRSDAGGVAYQPTAGTSITYFWTGEQLFRFNPKQKTYEAFSIPKDEEQGDEVRQVGSWDVLWLKLASPQRHLPGLIETDAARLQQRFDWTVFYDDQQRLILIGKTLLPEERRHHSELHVVLDPETFMTKAIKTIDSTGMKETVYVIESLAVNQPRPAGVAPWQPDFRGYKELTAPPLAPPAPITPLIAPSK